LQRLYSLQPFVRSLPYEPLCTFTEDLMLRLLAEDEHKTQYEQGDNFIKQLNSTTLRILENTDPNLVYAILLDLLIKHRRKL
jgi:cytoskeleton-associated protein 5